MCVVVRTTSSPIARQGAKCFAVRNKSVIRLVYRFGNSFSLAAFRGTLYDFAKTKSNKNNDAANGKTSAGWKRIFVPLFIMAFAIPRSVVKYSGRPFHKFPHGNEHRRRRAGKKAHFRASLLFCVFFPLPDAFCNCIRVFRTENETGKQNRKKVHWKS